jgi:hypothetical protein
MNCKGYLLYILGVLKALNSDKGFLWDGIGVLHLLKFSSVPLFCQAFKGTKPWNYKLLE